MDDRSADVDAGTTQDDLSGWLIADKYQIMRPLGRGSAGTVYLCWHLALDKQIALKVLHPELTGNPGMVARFQREAQAAARLEHPNSIHVMDFGQDPASGLLYLAMEYVQARDLGQVLAEDWPLSDGRIVGIMSQVLSALSAAHALGIVHRDLKPENILVRAATDSDVHADEDHVLVCDFGIAQLSPIRLTGSPTGSSARVSQVTGHGMVVGTPGYMSPEQARAESQDARSDLYSAGVVLFQLLTRTLPFMAQTPLSVAVMHCTTPPPPPSGYGPVNSALEAACLKALSKTREARFQSAREMQTALEGALSDHAVAGALARRISSVPPPVARNQPRARDANHPSLAPAERVVQHDSIPKHHWAPLVIGGLLLCIVAVGWLPRFLANDDTEQLAQLAQPANNARPQPSAAIRAPEARVMPLPDTEQPAHRSTAAQPGAAAVIPDALPQPPMAAAIAMASPGKQTSRHHSGAEGSHGNASAARWAGLEQAYTADAPPQVVPVPASTLEPSAPEPSAPEPSTLEPVGDVAERPIVSPLGAAADLPPDPGVKTSLELESAQSASSVSPVTEPAPAPAPPVPGVRPLASTPTAVIARQPIAPLPAPAAQPDPAGLAARARVSIADAFTRAAVSKSSILNAINQDGITHCYQSGLRNGVGPTRTISARLDFSTNLSGRIVFASLHGSELPKQLRECIEHVTRQGRLREADTGEAQASVTLTFQPR